MKAVYTAILFTLILAALPAGKEAMAQSCTGSVPTYSINMSGKPDSVWSVTNTRNGRCCGLSSSYKCIHFTVTLDSRSQGIRVDVSGASGYTYEANCGSSTNVGDTMCLTGGATHEITICRTGTASSQTFTIRSIPKPYVSDTINVGLGCSKKLIAKNFIKSTIKWQSLGNNSTYNSYLSCLTGCDTTTVTIPISGFPTYVDYVVSGYRPSQKCDTSKFYDTIRVYKMSSLAINAGPDTTICTANNAAYLHGTVSGGNSLGWTGNGGSFIPNSTSLTATYVPSLTEAASGSTFVVLSASASGGCFTTSDTLWIVFYQAPSPIITGPSDVCAYSVNNSYSVTPTVGHTYDWHVVGGTIMAGQGTDNVKVTWDTASPGYIYMVEADANGCQGVGAINTISRFDFNGGPLTRATIGPNATSYDTDAYSNGKGYQITSNCGGSKGIDLTVPGSVFNRGKMCMTYSWQRDESFANFFTRGGISFFIDGGVLQISIRISDGAGSYTDVGPLSTGYTVPNDDIFRYFTFCYDSASGKGTVMVHDSLVWSYNGTAGRELYWTGAGDAVIGTIMDGSCAGQTLLDWSNISIPISIIAKPKSNLSGPSPVCLGKAATYITSGQPHYKYSWYAPGGTIVSGQGNDTVTIVWTSIGTQTLQLTQTDSINGCDSSASLSVAVSATPPAAINGPDTVCIGIQNIYKGPNVSGATYQWSSATGVFSGSTSNDTALLTFNQYGMHTVSLKMTDTASGCDSTITLSIFADSIAVVNITGDNPVCQNAIGNYQTTSGSQYTYQWSATGGTITNGQGTAAISVNWATPGTGSASVLVQKPSGCNASGNMGVTVYPKPVTSSILYNSY
jgi:hypothetical protein